MAFLEPSFSGVERKKKESRRCAPEVEIPRENAGQKISEARFCWFSFSEHLPASQVRMEGSRL